MKETEQTKSYFDSAECIGCGICRQVCPAEVISGESKESHRVAPGLCINCSLCAGKCPRDAITMGYMQV